MGLMLLIIIQFILWILGFFVRGISLYQVLLIIPVIMFAVRKFGTKIGCQHIIVVEALFLFFSTVMTLLFGHIVMIRYILSLLLRVVSCLIAVVDDTAYIYVTEERKASNDRKK